MTAGPTTGAAAGGANRGIPPVALAAAFATLIFWSGTVVANRAAVESIDGLTAGALRSMLAGFIGLGIALAFRLPFPKAARHRCLLVVSGWINFAIWPTVLSLGVALANASHAALIMALLPVTTGLIAAIVNRVRPQPGWWSGAAIAIAGTGLLILLTQPAGDLALSPTWLIGDLVVLAGVLLCSAGYVGGAKLGPVVGSWSATFYGLGAALMLTVPAILILHPYTDWTAVTADSWLAMGWLTLCSSLAGYALWFLAMDRGGIARIAVFQFLQPVLSVAAAAVILGERITWTIVAAGLLILIGTWIAQKYAH
ncbi:MAG: DMT family transporter [Rhodospirillaceae bacterium]|nr:DMT family transporter [Rhodospirillaceae bacterium]